MLGGFSMLLRSPNLALVTKEPPRPPGRQRWALAEGGKCRKPPRMQPCGQTEGTVP